MGGITGLPGRGGITPGSLTGSGTFVGRPNVPTGPTMPGGFIARPQRSAAEITATVRRAIDTNPRSAFEILRQPETRIIGEASRLLLGREAVQKLSLKVETGGNATANLAEVRTARKHAAELPAEIRTSLDRLSAQAERTLLAEAVTEVAVRAERGKWGEATGKAKDWLGRLSEARLPEESLATAEFRARRTEMREAFNEAVDVGKRLDSLDRLQSALKTADGKNAEQTARKLGELDASSLNPRLKQQMEALRGLAELKAQAEQTWRETPKVSEIKDSVARLQRGLQELSGVDGTLCQKVLQELAVKAFLEGHAPEYFKLMPAEGPAEHAGNLLRDLKALALGEGKVETSPGSHALPVVQGKGPGSPRAPPGLEPLMPEGARDSWRPPVRETAKADLPPLEKAAALGKELQAKAEAGINPERAALQNKALAAKEKLNGVYQRIIAPEQAERRQFAEFEAVLDRGLRPIERVQVRELLARKQTPPQILAALKSQQQQSTDDETEFLQDVAKRLRRPLTEPEKGQALRLRRDGRTAAEVADILRT
jgi:hypothetical protein